jgi:hypothetical protein
LEQLLGLFRHLPQLKLINVRHIGSQQIIDSLKILLLHPPDIPIPFPKMNSIELYGGLHALDYTPKLFEELFNCLMQQHKYGANLSKLSLLWELTQEEVQHLQEVVADVQWRKRTPPVLPV